MAPQKHTVVALVEDRPGVLNRVASLFRRRGFNIDSLTVGPSETPGMSRMTIVVDGKNTVIDQVGKQLYKVIDVVKVIDLQDDEAVIRELALIKVNTTQPGSRSEIIELTTISNGHIVDVATDCIVVEMTGSEREIDDMIVLLRPYGIREVVRTGRAAMSRAKSNKGLDADVVEPNSTNGRVAG